MLVWGVDSRGQETVGRPFERLCKNPYKISGGLDQENSSVGGVSMSSGSRSALLDSEPRPVERGGAGRMTGGVKGQIGLVARNHILEAKG